MRSLRERAIQTAWFEAGGLALAAPLYHAVFGESAAGSAGLIAVIALLVAVWSPLHNALFDLAELRLAGRVASDRPHGLRLFHALSHETTSMLVTLPAIMALGGHGLWEAVAVDLGLSLFYAGYAYAFHLVYDRLRPVRRETRA
jgi:uncharacterized membrane protein